MGILNQGFESLKISLMSNNPLIDQKLRGIKAMINEPKIHALTFDVSKITLSVKNYT
jgi:hypothetical protein